MFNQGLPADWSNWKQSSIIDVLKMHQAPGATVDKQTLKQVEAEEVEA